MEFSEIKVSKMLAIRSLGAKDCNVIAEAFQAQGWDKTLSQYQSYLAEQERRKRLVLLAFWDNQFAGYLTIKWESYYPPFLKEGIPEIMDLNVLIIFQRKGIASALMNLAESLVSKVSSRIGIGVGLTSDYGNAQIMYIKRGYIPDGRGISYNEQFLNMGDRVTIDHDLILCLCKTLE